MKVLIAMDSFKGNLSSLDVASIVEAGIRKVFIEAQIEKVAVADGGEGTTDAILNALGGSIKTLDASDPMGNKVNAKYAIVNNDTAIIETAQASGLDLVPKNKLDPLLASSFGTGQLIKDAVDNGCAKIILALGGSATNDAGVGIASALGIKFLDKNGNQISAGGGFLSNISKIDVSYVDLNIKNAEIKIITDVTNPLLGEIGASRVFSPQKGASSEMVEILEENMKQYYKKIFELTKSSLSEIPGMGAAGGIALSLVAFFNSKIYKGTDFVLDLIGLDEKVQNADIIITGEGRIDKQTAYGKLPIGIAKIAKKYSKPVFAIGGFLDKGYEEVYSHGIDAALSSMVAPMSLSDAMLESKDLIEKASITLFRIIKALRI